MNKNSHRGGGMKEIQLANPLSYPCLLIEFEPEYPFLILNPFYRNFISSLCSFRARMQIINYYFDNNNHRERSERAKELRLSIGVFKLRPKLIDLLERN